MEKSFSSEQISKNVTQSLPPVNPELGAKKHLVRAAGIVGIMTLTSRILGMIRDIVSASFFGTTWQWDAFIYAFTLPNFFRRLVGEGAVSSAFIPVYSQILETQGRDRAFQFANIVGTAVATGLLALVLLLEIILTVFLHLPGIPERLRLTADLLRYFFPYLYCMAIFAWGMGILNSHRHFFSSSLSPVILDLFWIFGVLWVAPRAGAMPENQLRMLAWVILVSGVAQVAVELPALFHIGFRHRWVWDLAHEGLKKTVRLLLPAIMGFAIVQINIAVDMTLGFLIGPGASSALWYGNRIMQFPLGIFAIAMGTALLPTLARQAAGHQHGEVERTLSFALRSVFFIILPSTVGLILLGKPIVQLLFERGQFDAVSTARTTAVLICYAIGLFAHSGEKIIASAFFAYHDTKTPVKLGVVALLSNLVLNLILMRFMAEAGLALATSISGILELLLLIVIYQKKFARFPLREVGFSFGRVLFACLGMGIACAVSFQSFAHFFPGHHTQALVIQVFGSIVVSTVAYFLCCIVFRVPEIREAYAWITKRRDKR